MKRPTTKGKAPISFGVACLSDPAENGGNSGERVLWSIYWWYPHVDRPTFGRRIDAIQKDFLAWHVTSEGFVNYCLKNPLGLPFGQLLKCSSNLILGSKGSAGISGLEWAAATPMHRHSHELLSQTRFIHLSAASVSCATLSGEFQRSALGRA